MEKITVDKLAIPVFLKKSWSTCVSAVRKKNSTLETLTLLMDDIEFQLDDFESFLDETFKEAINN